MVCLYTVVGQGGKGMNRAHSIVAWCVVWCGKAEELEELGTKDFSDR